MIDVYSHYHDFLISSKSCVSAIISLSMYGLGVSTHKGLGELTLSEVMVTDLTHIMREIIRARVIATVDICTAGCKMNPWKPKPQPGTAKSHPRAFFNSNVNQTAIMSDSGVTVTNSHYKPDPGSGFGLSARNRPLSFSSSLPHKASVAAIDSWWADSLVRLFSVFFSICSSTDPMRLSQSQS